jgi:predicted DsbA family dithiol-disulfide isomerase
MHARVGAMFEAVGLEYNPHPEVVPRSLDALRLTGLARDVRLHEPMHNRLMDAYWAEGRDIGDHDVLRAVAAAVGLPADDVERVLAGDDYRERVEQSTQSAVSLGVGGVPGWLLDERLLVQGAQPREVFEQALTRLEAA